MKRVDFYKYHGAGNDFILIDNRENIFPIHDEGIISAMCSRRLGIGADGLILISNDMNVDFYMTYYNADGKEGSMCGNGGRCAVAFAQKLGIVRDKTMFSAVDGAHIGILEGEMVNLKMKSVDAIEWKTESSCFLDTGSPHYVVFVDSVDDIDVNIKGKEIRYSEAYAPRGTNVNFVEILGERSLKIRTYERGVERETLACGTGAVAASLAYTMKYKLVARAVKVEALGGELCVQMKKEKTIFTEIWLEGPVKEVFMGRYNV